VKDLEKNPRELVGVLVVPLVKLVEEVIKVKNLAAVVFIK
jgi:hypothetical protein